MGKDLGSSLHSSLNGLNWIGFKVVQKIFWNQAIEIYILFGKDLGSSLHSSLNGLNWIGFKVVQKIFWNQAIEIYILFEYI
jgi:hypothetical protein